MIEPNHKMCSRSRRFVKMPRQRRTSERSGIGVGSHGWICRAQPKTKSCDRHFSLPSSLSRSLSCPSHFVVSRLSHAHPSTLESPRLTRKSPPRPLAFHAPCQVTMQVSRPCEPSRPIQRCARITCQARRRVDLPVPKVA